MKMLRIIFLSRIGQEGEVFGWGRVECGYCWVCAVGGVRKNHAKGY